MDLRRLNYFIAVAEELNFSRAAERLHISQPPLSQQIQALERDLGVCLLLRTRRSVSLTQAGRVFYESACRIAQEYAHGKRQAQMAHKGAAGRVRLAFTASVPLFQGFPQLLQRFRADFPQVEVVLRHLSTGEQLEALAQGSIDVGFLRPSPSLRCPQGLRWRALWSDELMLAVAASHPRAAQDGQNMRLEEYAAEPFVLQPQTLGCGLSGHIAMLTSQAGFTPDIAQESNETSTTLALVAANLGVSIVPSIYQRIRPEGVHFHPLAAMPAASGIRLASRQDEGDLCVASFVRYVDSAAALPG
jgi:DNA-binding transcriptional LysR family regulator